MKIHQNIYVIIFMLLAGSHVKAENPAPGIELQTYIDSLRSQLISMNKSALKSDSPLCMDKMSFELLITAIDEGKVGIKFYVVNKGDPTSEIITHKLKFGLGGCQPAEDPSISMTHIPDPTEASVEASGFKPQPVIDIEHIQPFRLKQPYKYYWRRDHPDVESGLLVVLKVDPDMVTPRNALEPVLYAGNQTVQRLNHGHESGFVIGIIPGRIDLSQEPVWFGTPALPERIDAKMIEKERAKAERSGISALKATDIQGRTRDMIVASDLTTLLREQAANLLLKYSPQEKRLADSWRLPVTSK